MHKDKLYLISGIGTIGKGGVNRLMNNLIVEAKKHKVRIIIKKKRKRTNFEINRWSKVKFYISKLLNRINKNVFRNRLLRIKDSRIILIHPQTVGLDLFLKLLENNIVYLYVMDNSFFCLKSYNTNPKTNTECLLCLSNPENVLDECSPFPVKINKEINTKMLLKLKDKKNLRFFVQNNKQEMLIRMHFGNEAICNIVGLNTGELSKDIDYSNKKVDSIQYDIVYHAAAIIPKGIIHCIEIAGNLSDFSFFIPEEKVNVEAVIGEKIDLVNITFQKVTWETGLAEIVSAAKLVLHLSSWSAPIEGALLKSLFYNGKVATLKTKYGFESELSEAMDILRLSTNYIEAADKIKIYINNENSFRNENKSKINRYTGDKINIFEYLSKSN